MITTKEDEYTQSYMEGNARWVVELEDGTTVFCDDGRQSTDKSAWERLYDYCHENQVFIKKMFIHFRSHRKGIPENKDGYYFSRMIRRSGGSIKPRHFFIVGYREGDKVHLTKYCTPELILEEEFTRSIEECCNKYKYSLIDKEYETTPDWQETS